MFFIIISVSNHSLIHGSDNMGFERYKERVKVLHEMLRAECKDVQLSRMRRDLSSDVSKTQQEVEIILYERMTRMLIECRKRNSITTAQTTTTTSPQPEECQSAINLTEFWRLDHNGSSYRPGGSYNCDTSRMISRGRPWFRFSGSAGNMMLDKCPPTYSCGTAAGLWTDNQMPTIVGVQRRIEAYGSWSSGCKEFTKVMHVMRCSDNSFDLIYKYLGDSDCTLGFCGMTKFN